ncbi:hypothetical protein JDV02_007680 [Purpureocillium takamizusanense]|uniref:Zn(2)-C6 fungal-type domain-containing protein n=1 Tax=Purpureocillium takamizusanense TaxID=2060973 RepID=A0A9Q8QLB6_9HYPO|nr:uncharacterized protein JDV02_007680 [Purpureocillium takamizusanense]UNI21720.1 hypothetical protein JDV02_007680 [Purpureocillium takamizusanense]
MGDYYHHFLTSMSGVEDYSPAGFQHSPQLPGGLISTQGNPAALAYQSTQRLGYIRSFPEPTFPNTPKPSKGRRKVAATVGNGTDHVKHRRTRSGCFMCRSRRVKCDETRPICERCKKGNRECIYPDPPGPKGAPGPGKSKEMQSSTCKASPSSSNEGDEDDRESSNQLETIYDDDESEDALQQAPGPHSQPVESCGLPHERQGSEGLIEDGVQVLSSPSTSTAGSISVATRQSCDLPSSGGRTDWSHLPPDFQHHLTYYVDNITNYHYSLANDGDAFFGTIMPSLAINHEPLLYALVGFSAYHATLENPNGQLQDFLGYYNRSVTLLLDCIKRKETNNVPVLVTILQLATMDEFLGDWVNLMGHQKAALEIITKVFTPETVMLTPVGRACLNWYSRYDNYVAIMGGFPTELPREWFEVMVSYSQSHAAVETGNVRWKADERSSRLRMISYDMSMLYARGSRGQISPEGFRESHEQITQRLLDWKSSWDPALTDPAYLVTDFSYQRPLDVEDIVDPYEKGILFKPPLFTTTLITAEWHSIFIMHLSQSIDTPQSQLFEEIGQHAYVACQYFESVEFWPLKPKGALISLQPCISIAALFLPHDMRHQMWIRRKFALLDMLGCIHPTARRIKMAQVFRDPSCARWWLPNDAGLTPVLQNIRAFADDRNAAAVNAQQENIREVRHLFAKLEVGLAEPDAQVKAGESTGH